MASYFCNCQKYDYYVTKEGKVSLRANYFAMVMTKCTFTSFVFSFSFVLNSDDLPKKMFLNKFIVYFKFGTMQNSYILTTLTADLRNAKSVKIRF